MKDKASGYIQRSDGRFRLRASFDIPVELVERMNAIAARTGKSMAALCRLACEQFADSHARSELAPAYFTGGGAAENPPASGSPVQGGTAPAGPA